MGVSSSRQGRQLKEPEDIGDFRESASPTTQYVIPEVPEKRKVTDFSFTVIFAIFIVVLLPFLIYTFVNSDVSRITNGYDLCGNVCGKNNSRIEGIICSGKDETKFPLLKYELDRDSRDEFINVDEKWSYSCVESCDKKNYQIIINRCFPVTQRDFESKEILTAISQDINKSAGYIVLLCLVGLGFSIGMLFLFRYFPAVVVWVILVGSVLGIIVLTVVFWYLYNGSNGDKGLQYLAIVFTVVSLTLVVLLVCMFKRINLVIRLFREAITVVFGIPVILLEPFLTFIATTIVLFIFIAFNIIFLSAGSLEVVGVNRYQYIPNTVIVFTFFYNFVICLWMLQFIMGCQHMVIAGAVSAYYFARDKSTLVSPIYNSFYNLIKYHLGTVAFGSLLITVIALIKALIRSLANSRQTRILVDCCLGAIEDFLKYLSKNAYIQTAMHGQPFYKSGKRAVRLLAANFLSTIAVNSVGDFVLNMAKVLIIIFTIGVGALIYPSDITHFWAAIFISAFVTAIIADCFFSVFETAVDTIFLCFCEDNFMNDGVDRPYYMTTNLMQYIEDAKKTVKDRNLK